MPTLEEIKGKLVGKWLRWKVNYEWDNFALINDVQCEIVGKAEEFQYYTIFADSEHCHYVDINAKQMETLVENGIYVGRNRDFDEYELFDSEEQMLECKQECEEKKKRWLKYIEDATKDTEDITVNEDNSIGKDTIDDGGSWCLDFITKIREENNRINEKLVLIRDLIKRFKLGDGLEKELNVSLVIPSEGENFLNYSETFYNHLTLTEAIIHECCMGKKCDVKWKEDEITIRILSETKDI